VKLFPPDIWDKATGYKRRDLDLSELEDVLREQEARIEELMERFEAIRKEAPIEP
jgi:hypothetical protein